MSLHRSGRIGVAAPETRTARELRERRVANARRVSTWTELDAADLVRRGSYWVSATSDEVFTPYAGAAFDRSGVVVHSQANPLRFFVDPEREDVLLLERAPRHWSEMVYGSERAKARASS